MLFPTLRFAVFFLCVFLGFWYVFRRNTDRKIFLVLASYAFYACWDWRFCFILLASTSANYGLALLLRSQQDHFRRKAVLVLSVVVNLLFLGFFKYYNFFAATANGMLRMFAGAQGDSFLFPVFAVLLPVGISFYTFKAMSYVFDVYLCRMPAVRSFLDVMLYVSFFPQLASGPIVQAHTFIPKIEAAVSAGIEPGSKPIEFDRALVLVLSGLLKKLVFANFLSTLFVDPVFADPASFNTLEILLAAIGYSVVIYTDFSGYSDLAIGIALLLGFDTPANFNRPYTSFSVTDFWKRWHISFSSWLREYLYFSMGGSRFGKVRNIAALLLTMILGGLWHGASWNFIIWGAMQGTALAVERGLGYGESRSRRPWLVPIQIGGTFLFVTLSWIVFRLRTLDEIGAFFHSLGNISTAITLVTPLVLILIGAGLAMHAIPGRARKAAYRYWTYVPLPFKALLLAFFMALLAVVSMSGVAPFIYFQF